MQNINIDCRASLQQPPILKELRSDCKNIVQSYKQYHIFNIAFVSQRFCASDTDKDFQARQNRPE